MRMTISRECAIQNFPEARHLKEGESVLSDGGRGQVVSITRLTEAYYKVRSVN